MIKLFTSLVLFVVSATAQCISHPQPGVTHFIPVISPGCNEITSGVAPWLSINAAPSASLGGMMTFVWNDIPTYVGDPAIYSTIIAISAQQSAFQFPGTTNLNCLWVAGTDIIINTIPLMVGPGCTATPWIVLPPMPSLVALTLYCQGAVWDQVQNKYAVSPAFRFTFQP